MTVDVDESRPANASLTDLDDIPLERVEAELIGWAGHLAAATARWLHWLASYDRREGWEQWGCRSAAQWLSWKCGMSLHTARVHVRVARALEELPLVSAAFAAGELSFSKVRALTRLERPIDEVELVEAARTATASQLDRIVAGCRQAANSNDDPSRPAIATRRYRERPLPDGTVEIIVVATAIEAERIDATIAASAERRVVERERGVSAKARVDELGGWDSIRADAAIELLTAQGGPRAGAEPVELVVEIEAAPTGRADSVEGWCATSGRHVPNEVARRLGCDAVIAVAADRGYGQAGDDAGAGRRQRIVPAWLRRQLERRDHHCCQFPGCATARRLHAHHIVHWLDGGPTDLDNLILLCSFHHHLMHEGGWNIRGRAGQHRIYRPDGVRITVTHLAGQADALLSTPPTSSTSLEARWAGERFDLVHVVDVFTNTRPNERPRPLDHEPRGVG